MHIFTGANWGTSVRFMFFCIIGGLSVVVMRLIRGRAPLSPARPWSMASDALIGAAGLFVANVWFNTPDLGGLWAGLFFVDILESLIHRFILRRNSN